MTLDVMDPAHPFQYWNHMAATKAEAQALASRLGLPLHQGLRFGDDTCGLQ